VASPIAVDRTLTAQNATVTEATLLTRPVLADSMPTGLASRGLLERSLTLVSFARRL
jgi:hypothetical protein